MSWVIEDEAEELHEILEDERVLVLAANQECARMWMRYAGLPPYGRQFVVSPSSRALEGGRWDVVVRTACSYQHPDAVQITRILSVQRFKTRKPPRTILVACR